MRAHLVQMDIAWEDRERNLSTVDRMLRDLDTSTDDLIVLPEMFDSGFSLNTALTADSNARTAKYLLELADDLGCVVQGGRTVRACPASDDERRSGLCKAANEACIAAPGHVWLASYAKIHPFTYGREGDAFDGGDRVVTYRLGANGGAGLVVCPAICYDLRFPELFRIGLSMGAEAFAIGANWPAARQTHWRTLLLARAIENQAIVLGVNRVGRDPNVDYAGGTIAVGPRGEVLGELGNEPGVLSVEMDADSVRGWRETFPAWRDMKLIGSPAAAEARGAATTPTGGNG